MDLIRVHSVLFLHTLSCVLASIHTQSPGRCSYSVVKTTAHIGSVCVTTGLSVCACLSIFVCLVLLDIQVLCRVRAIFGSSFGSSISVTDHSEAASD